MIKKTSQSRKKKTGPRKTSLPRTKLKPTFNGISGLAASFTAIGIPPVIESEISDYHGLSGQLLKHGNIPYRSGYGVKIKL